MQQYDVLIIGSGMVGSALACALAQQTSLSIAVLESSSQIPEWSAEQYQPRVSAISLSSQRIFTSLGVWNSIKEMRVSPFTQIYVWDANSPGQIHFNSREIAEPLLGYIIENNVIQIALHQRMRQHANITYLAPVKLTMLHEFDDRIELMTDAQEMFRASLVVAADGAKSWLREQANIKISQHDYQQAGIVTTVETELAHEQVARQVFRDTGPLAFLPLAAPNLASIVWSAPSAEAERLMQLDDANFKLALSQAFGRRLGDIVRIDKRFSFPLKLQQASQYVKHRVALVGDAAHTVHPLAGQGVNMGLLDAACLSQVIKAAYDKQRDFASLYTLRRYERWRRADNAGMMTGVDAIKKLFASDKAVTQGIRALGVNLTDYLTWVKNFFCRHAIGNRGDLPGLAQNPVA